MKLESIITLANNKVRLRFVAMERSLRAVGCDLPLKVIPYDENRFDLPDRSSWWEMPEISEWLGSGRAAAPMRRYQCLTIANYQFVDSDICFLRNPSTALAPYDGFVVCCGHWRAADHTVDAQSRTVLSKRSTLWERQVFNSGQFACDRVLYTVPQLIEVASSPKFRATCLDHPIHDQPGLNLLVIERNPPFVQLTLPPYNFESSWAGDYDGDPHEYWNDRERMPYLIHWAGTRMDQYRKVHEIFLSYLTQAERAEWDGSVEAQRIAKAASRWTSRAVASRLRAAALAALGELGRR